MWGYFFKAFYYDELDRIYESYRNGQKLTYHYGSDGNVSYITDIKTTNRTQYEYDLADRVVSIKEFNDEAPYLFDLNSSVSYTYVNGTNQIDTITSKTGIGTNTLDVTFPSISASLKVVSVADDFNDIDNAIVLLQDMVTKEDKLVMLFSREESQPLYILWKNRELR